MSHFTVTVRLSAKTHKNAPNETIGGIIKGMMEPYNENTKNKKYIKFHDEDGNWRKEWKTEGSRMIRCPDGTLKEPTDEQFRVAGSFGYGYKTHEIPEDHVEIEIPLSIIYPDFDDFAKKYHGGEKDRATGHYGWYSNPNGYWDWYTIGGRWAGFYPTKSEANIRAGEPSFWHEREPEKYPVDKASSDYVLFSDIDWDRVKAKHDDAVRKFYTEYCEMVNGKSFPPFEGPRDMAFKVGLLKIVKSPQYKLRPDEVESPWTNTVNPDDSRAKWRDIMKKIADYDRFTEEHGHCWHPMATYAVLDNQHGWLAPGKMGWFAMDDSTPNSYGDYKRWYVNDFLRSCKPDDLLVLLDCHV